jgi:hypothetical protein
MTVAFGEAAEQCFMALRQRIESLAEEAKAA